MPGAIQPHGAMLVALADSLLVTHASANLLSILGRPARTVLGRPLTEALGAAARDAMHRVVPDDGGAFQQTYDVPGPDGRTFNLRAHQTGRHLCLDIEPVRPKTGKGPTITMAQSVLETFKHAGTQRHLCELAVRGLKTITAYDRVMAYCFHADGHGEVIAEAREAHLEPYLGLHYPAADIPHQARALYLRQRVGAIADANYLPVPLLVDQASDNGTLLDLTHSALRSVSPVHREYMRNMGTTASLTIALSTANSPTEEKLWGMLVCHHATRRVAGSELRAVADMIGQVVSLLLARFGEAEGFAQRLDRNAALKAMISRLEAPLPPLEALAAAETELLDLVDAAGAMVSMGGTTIYLGRTPQPPVAQRILAMMRAEADGAVLARDDLGTHPELPACTREGSGALLLPLLPGVDEAILWFRPELPRTLAWAGDPAHQAGLDPLTGQLSPRASFAAWRQTVKGYSAPWVEADLAIARELRNVIEAAVAQRTKADLARLRHFDSLTGLPNRSLLQDRLREAELAAGASVALLFLDLDRFKAVNDTMGHAAGDALLVEVGRRLHDAAGPDNLAARLGGDEFVVLCPGLDQDAVAALGEHVRRAVEAPFDIGGRACHVSASIGFALSGQSGGLDLVRAADIAMYEAKQSGGNRGVLFERSLFDRAAQQREIELDMRDALRARDQFVLLYQPLFEIAAGTRHLVGFEALVRWRHPRHGWMSAPQFIPLAEKSGLILPLGDWVLATALHQGRALRLAWPDAHLLMTVNMSLLQLPQTSFCADLAGLLEAEGFPPSSLWLELTESVLTDVAATAVLADVRKLGVRVAIDDFGIGYSSLSYLRRLPVDVVKLDRSFLEDVEGDSGGEAFVVALVALAHAAGKPVVFEGIETQAQFDIVMAARADMAQGFLFAPPLSASAAEELVIQHRQLDKLHKLPRHKPHSAPDYDQATARDGG